MVNRYLTPGAILDSANTWLADQSFGNGVAVTFGATSQETISNGDGATDLVPEVQVQGTTQADGSLMLLVANTINTRAAAPTLALVKGGDAVIGTPAALADDEVVGNIIAYGDDGEDYESPVGSIQFVINGTPGTGDMPGSIEFYTTATGGETLTLAMTLEQDQRARFKSDIFIVTGKQVYLDSTSYATHISSTSLVLHGYIELKEMTAPGYGAANHVRIYAVVDGGGLTDLAAVFQDGTIDIFAQEV